MNTKFKSVTTILSLALIFTVITAPFTVNAEITLNKKIFVPYINSTTNNSSSNSATFFLSPTGSDRNSGTSEGQAWATFDHAWTYLYPGDTLILLDGVYHQTISPGVRNGLPGKLINIRAKNDGKAIIEGDGVRIPVKIGYWANPDIGHYFDIEGIVAQDSSAEVYMIWGSHNIFRRDSGYNANKDDNTHVFTIGEAQYNLVEDCIASGTGRKMVLIWGGGYNTIRRCFTNWVRYDGRNFAYWPWGEDLEIYNGSNNIIEDSISYGSPPQTAVSLYANIDSQNGNNPYSKDNKILGVMAIRNGVYKDGTFWDWGTTRPSPTNEPVVSDYHNWAGSQIGFGAIMWGEQSLITNTLYQDIFSFQNAGLGFSEYANYNQKSVNTVMNRATIINNGLNAPTGDGGPGTNVKIDQFSHYTITDSKIAGTQYNGGGARFVNRYVDGVLQDGTNQTTATALWPWPMQNRALTELGVDVTGEITEILRTNSVSTGKTLPAPVISPQPYGVDNEIATVPNVQSYTQPVSVTITSPTNGAVIRYTTNGVEPDAGSPVYSAAIPVSSNTLVKAKAFYNGQESYSRSAFYRFGAANKAPVVAADLLPFRYAYMDVMLPNNQVSLYGLAYDDTLSATSSLATTWSQVSGPGTVTFSNAAKPRSTATLPAKPGIYVLRLTASDGTLSSTKDVTIHLWPQDNSGTVFSLPGRIDAVNFKAGGEGVGFHESAFSYGGVYRSGLVSQTIAYNDFYGYAVSDIAPGEWYAYNVSVATAGTYTLNVKAASEFGGGMLHIERRDSQGNVTNLTGSFTVPNTGSWRTFITLPFKVTLPQGQYELRLVGDQNAPGQDQTYALVHYMEFTLP